MRFLYTFCFQLLLPVVLLRLWWKGRRSPAYRARWAERFGQFAGARPGGIWVHAVSLGETIAALPLIKALQARYPELPITVTTTTPTGSERVRQALGDSVFHVYAPYDLPWCLSAFLRRIQPKACLVMETELWPNTLHACAARGIPVVLANARLSARSARGYARFSALTKPMLACLSRVAAQHEDDARRFLDLGLPAERVTVTGSIKFDLSIPEALRGAAAGLRAGFGARPVWIAASTHRGEDESVLAAHRALRARFPQALLILVPRHPERFGEVAALCATQGERVARRSAGEAVGPDTSVYLGDTLGELLIMYGAADLAFVGGSLVPVGGHNFLEPAALGLPCLSGPHDFNFADIARQLAAAGGLRRVADAAELAEAVGAWLAEPEAREAAGAAALGVVEANRGALARLLELVDKTF
ncbi:MAG: lipid IV(A) 3-deoxy-D-manno-octulosonic acid transferase [Gammaproteobacteria bacterium]|nr:lipid IV(A) 3-deoxy-D-manno-octulosonic acid transferase [Gammaproteobacteria bacterium]